MKVNIEARYYQSGDEDQIVEVLKSSFPDWARREDPMAYWRWKYMDTPLGAGIEVGIVDERIICVNHTTNLRIKVFSDVLPSQYGDDAASHPDFRGKGFFSALLGPDNSYKSNHGITFGYSVPISPVMVRINTRKGSLNNSFRIRELSRIRDEGLYVKHNKVGNPGLIRFGLLVLKLYNRLLPLLNGAPNREGGFRINEVTKFECEFDAFWDSIKSSYDFIVERSSRYLNWRYSPVSGGYKIFVALEGADILGYVISIVKKKNGFAEGFIVDMLFKNGRRDVGDALIKRATNYLDNLGVNTINYTMVKGGPEYGLALTNGFLDPPTPDDIPFQFGYTDSAKNIRLKDLNPGRIHFTYADYQF